MPAAAINSCGFPGPRQPRNPRRKKPRTHGPPPGLAVEDSPTRLAQTALRPVVLDHDEAVAGRLRRRPQRLAVYRLDRVEVDHADGDAVLLERVVSFQRLVQRDAGADDSHLVLVGLARDL